MWSTARRSNVTPLIGLLNLTLVALAASGCDVVIDKIREVAPTAPGSGVDGGGPVPPPPTDTKPTPPPPTCRSSSECAAGTICSTEWGVCLSPPGCGPGVACPAVCYGTCESGKPQCQSDADCRLHSSYCEGCSCQALGKEERAPNCGGNTVQCFVDPCQGKTAVCSAGRCLAQAPPPPPCAETKVAGDETTCKTQSDWKDHAYKACLAQGMILQNYSVGGGDCGVGMTRMVKYDCCPERTAPPPPDSGSGAGGSGGTTTPPPPSGGACAGGSDGSPTSCKSPDIWKSYASDTCAKQGLTLTDIGFGEDCGGGNYRYMKYVCCPKQ